MDQRNKYAVIKKSNIVSNWYIITLIITIESKKILEMMIETEIRETGVQNN